MKKYFLILLLLLFTCSLKADIPIKTLSHFASSWLYQYSPGDYEDIMLHPYTVADINVVEVPALGELGVLWDLNSDGIVNLRDYSILSRIDMTQLIKSTKKLQGNFSEEYMQTSLTRIMDKEKELGIDNLKLFKILLYESGFEVNVYNYDANFLDTDFDFTHYWENETQYGTINMKFDFEFLFGIPTGYTYTYTYKYYVKGN